MNELFRKHIEALHPKFEALLRCQPCRALELSTTMPNSGIYLFSEGEKNLYVGRSNRMRNRLLEHGRAGCKHFSASFAFRIAREESGFTARSYGPAGSRSDLSSTPPFDAAFQAAKHRVRAMEIRFVEETDQERQALLEIYAAISLQTPFNEFGTH